MSLRETLIHCGVTPERADAMLDRLLDEDEGVAQHAYRETLRALTPMLLQTLTDLAKVERRK
jgi:hypothetical protein